MRQRLDEVRAAVDAALQAAMADLPSSELPTDELTEAMRYACTGGKRLRAFLVLEGARLHGVAEAAAMPVAAAVEALHAYSLVHDDLPAMDDDDLRRGQPTVHVRWSDAVAILAGDALQSLAFGLLATPAIGTEAARLRLISAFAEAVGARGMVWGQAQDIAAETSAPLGIAGVEALQQAKTGALFGFAAGAGPMIAGADPSALLGYARHLGLAFQIADDLLDATGDPERAGKRTRKDAAANKATFVSLLGIEGARDKARVLADRAGAALSPYGEQADNLRALARFVIDRDT